MRTRKGVLAGFGALAAGVLIGGAAWACTPQASLRANPTAGTAGSTITMTGSTYDAAGGPVTLWFDGAGRTQIGTATVKADRTFSVQVTIPASVAAGTHIISATQSDANGQPIAGSPVNTTFRVEGPTPAPAPAANIQGSAPDDAQGAAGLAPAPVAEATAAPAVAPAPAPAPAPARTPAVRTPARATAPAPAPAAPAPVVETPAPAVVPAPALEVAPAPAEPAPAPAPVAEPAAAPVQPAQSSSDDGGSSGLVVALLAVLALGVLAVGGGMFLSERKKSRARA